MHNPFRIGTDLYLRPLESEDLPVLTHWTTRSDIRTALDLLYRPSDRPAAELFLERIQSDEHDIALGIVTKETDTLLGFIGLNCIDQENRQVQLGFFIGAQKDGREKDVAEAIGLMERYVFEALNMNRVWLYVDAAEFRTIKTLERVGFSREATLRQDRRLSGRYYDTLVLGKVRGKEPPGPGGCVD